jgi:hypothetical protein
LFLGLLATANLCRNIRMAGDSSATVWDISSLTSGSSRDFIPGMNSIFGIGSGGSCSTIWTFLRLDSLMFSSFPEIGSKGTPFSHVSQYARLLGIQLASLDTVAVLGLWGLGELPGT